MGTPIVNVQKNSAALQNCAFVSTLEMTKNNPAKPFGFLMEASMLGVGVGFDDKGAEKEFTIYEPKNECTTIVIPDTREGWVESTVELLNSYLKSEQNCLEFDYSEIRPAGAPIATFGGTAAGHEPLERLHNYIHKLFKGRAGELVTKKDIADIGNLIGVCVVSGNVRRSAELLIGSINDSDFLNLKNADVFPERNSYDPDAPGFIHYRQNSRQATVEVWLASTPKYIPPLTTAQQLAVSVLVGEPDRAVLSALCDLLIEQGHEYAAGVAEKARAEERERIRNLVLSYANGADPQQTAAAVMYGLYDKL
jgi:hypothetical protein